MTGTARFLWLADVMEVRPQDHILEIGCGAGLAIEQIGQRIEAGSITAIDRSQSMIAKAMLRNDELIRSGKAEFIVSDLAAVPVGSHTYDKIFAFNVNLFWTQKSIDREIAVIRSHLAKRGRLYLFFQPPSPGKMKPLAAAVSDNLRKHAFEILDTLYESRINSCCLIARPA